MFSLFKTWPDPVCVPVCSPLTAGRAQAPMIRRRINCCEQKDGFLQLLLCVSSSAVGPSASHIYESDF